MNIKWAEKKLTSVHTNKYMVFKNIACMHCNNICNPFHKVLLTICFNK